jgi:hypothetical protein
MPRVCQCCANMILFLQLDGTYCLMHYVEQYIFFSIRHKILFGYWHQMKIFLYIKKLCLFWLNIDACSMPFGPKHMIWLSCFYIWVRLFNAIFGWDSLYGYHSSFLLAMFCQDPRWYFLFALCTELNIWYTVKQHIISFFILQIVWLLMSDKLKKNIPILA